MYFDKALLAAPQMQIELDELDGYNYVGDEKVKQRMGRNYENRLQRERLGADYEGDDVDMDEEDERSI